MSVDHITPTATEQVPLSDDQITAEVEKFLSVAQPHRTPYYGGLKYTAEWWAHRNASRGY